MEYRQSLGRIRLARADEVAEMDSDVPSPEEQQRMRQRSRDLRSTQRVCVIRTRDGKVSEHRGRDAPSVNAVLLFYKRRKLKDLQERNRSPLDRKQRMLRNLQSRMAPNSEGAERLLPLLSAPPSPWWEKIGMLRS
jgi:hypothetical protein